MADVLKFIIELTDKISAPAKNADKAVSRLTEQIQKEGVALERLEQKMIRMNRQDKVSLEAHRALKERIGDKRQKLVSLTDSLSKHAKQTAASNAAEAEEAARAAASATALTIAGGAMAVVTVAAAGLYKGLTLVKEGLDLAIEAHELKSDTLDMLEAMTGSSVAAEDTYRYINAIQGSVAISQQRGAALAQELSAAGITETNALKNAIKSIGEVESVLGAEAGGKVQNILERAAQSGKFEISAKMLAGTGIQVQKLYENIAARTGKGIKTVEAEMKAGKVSAEVGIAALTDVLDKKFAGVAGKQVLDLGNQLTRFHDNITRIFEDVNTDKLMRALADVLSIFDQSTVSGKLLHDTVTFMFTKIADGVAAAMPYIKTFFRGMLILGLQAYIGLKPFLHALDEMGDEGRINTLQMLADVMSVIGMSIKVQMQGASAILIGVVNSLKALIRIVDWLAGIPEMIRQKGGEIGSALVEGFKEGILAMMPSGVATVVQFGAATVDAMKATWKTHSPSRVAEEEIAGMVGLGFVKGLDKWTRPANDAVSRFASPEPAKAAASGGGARGGSTVTVTFQAGAIVIQGVPNAEAVTVTLPAVLTDVIEQAVLGRAAAG